MSKLCTLNLPENISPKKLVFDSSELVLLGGSVWERHASLYLSLGVWLD